MFKRIRLRFRDMNTLAKLIPGADKYANSMGEEKAGAEHFVLSALELADGSARRAMEKLGIDSTRFRDAIKTQYDQALSSVGVTHNAVVTEPEPIATDSVFHESQPSGVDLIKSLHALKKQDRQRPILGAHVILVAAAIEHGVVPRAFSVLGVDRDLLAQAARQEIESTVC